MGGNLPLLFIFLGLPAILFFFFFSYLALNEEGGFNLQTATGYTCVFQPVWIKGTFIVSITAHTGL